MPAVDVALLFPSNRLKALGQSRKAFIICPEATVVTLSKLSGFNYFIFFSDFKLCTYAIYLFSECYVKKKVLYLLS